jgi:hypothetical protein
MGSVLGEATCLRCGKPGRPLGETFIAGMRRFTCRCGRVWLESRVETPRPATKRDRGDGATKRPTRTRESCSRTLRR